HWGDRALVQDRIKQIRRRVAAKWLLAGCHFVQDSAKGKQIRTGVQLFPPRLLRGHVCHRANSRTRARQVFFPKSGLRGVARRYRNSPSGDLGQSKVEDLGMATFGHEDVRWFDVAIDNTHAAATELLDDAVVRDGPPDHADAILGALQWEVNATRIAGPAVDATAKSRPVFGATTSAVLPLQALFYCSFAYSALASFRMGMSESASFQRVRKCL